MKRPLPPANSAAPRSSSRIDTQTVDRTPNIRRLDDAKSSIYNVLYLQRGFVQTDSLNVCQYAVSHPYSVLPRREQLDRAELDLQPGIIASCCSMYGRFVQFARDEGCSMALKYHRREVEKMKQAVRPYINPLQERMQNAR